MSFSITPHLLKKIKLLLLIFFNIYFHCLPPSLPASFLDLFIKNTVFCLHVSRQARREHQISLQSSQSSQPRSHLSSPPCLFSKLHWFYLLCVWGGVREELCRVSSLLCGLQRQTQAVGFVPFPHAAILSDLHLAFWDSCLSLNLENTDWLGWLLASPRDPPACCSLGGTGTCLHVQLLTRVLEI